MSEIVVETTPTETLIEIDGGPVLTTTVNEVVQTIVSEEPVPVVIDLNSGPRGEPGSSVLTGPFPPPLEVGSVGDIYLVAEGVVGVGDVYRKLADSWEEVGNIRGPAGGIASVNGKLGPEVVLVANDLGLGQVDNTSDLDKPISTETQTALDLKAAANDTVNLTGVQTITGVKTFSSGPIVSDNSFAISKVNGLQTALNGKPADSTVVHLAGAETITGLKEFNGGLSLPGTQTVLFSTASGVGPPTLTTRSAGAKLVLFPNLSATLTDYSIGIESGNMWYSSGSLVGGHKWYTNDVNTMSLTSAGVLTATSFAGSGANLTGLTKIQVGLANVDNTSDANKPVSTATQTALNLKANLASPTFTGTVSGITAAMVGLGNVTNNAQVDLANAQTIAGIKTFSASPIVPTPTTGTQAANMTYVDTKVAALVNAAPATLDTLNELATALGNDANFSTTMTNNLALKAPLASPTFTGTVSGITKAMVGLSNVDNTTDLLKPISTATQTALNLKQDASTAVTLAGAQTLTGAKTFSAVITASAGMTTAGEVSVPGSSYYSLTATGQGAPSVSTRSAGTKVLLYPTLDATNSDYAIGIESSNLWMSVGSTARGFKWYAAATQIASLSGTGNLVLTGTATAGNFIGDGSALTALNGSNISSGTVADARIATTIARLSSPVFTGTPVAPTPATTDNDTQIATTAFVKAALLAAHPVGDIKMTTTNVNPSTYLGGTWVAWGAGRVPVGVDATLPADFDTVEKTGGARSVTLTAAQSGMPAHTPTFTQSPHNHTEYNMNQYVQASGPGALGNNGVKDGAVDAANANITMNQVPAQNASQSHTNLQPYITCYMWKRTA